MDIDAIRTLERANLHKAKGELNEALHLLQALTKAHPHFAAAFNNLGTVYYVQGNFPASINAYQTAIDLESNYIDAYYNLGLVFTKINDLKAAMNAYDALLLLSPQHAPARFQLACLYMLQSDYQTALNHFLKINVSHPHHAETKTNLATCYLMQGDLQAAEKYYLEALSFMPNDTQLLFNLGVINAQLGKMDAAIDYYEKTVILDPSHLAAQQNLGFIFLVKKEKANALKHFREVLRLEPHNEAVQHTIHILSNENNISASPPAYIRNLFDSYADHYDQHLNVALHYQVPQLLFAALQPFITKDARLHILDLGCGTGLCGTFLKPVAETLVGVDLSQNMLAEAGRKKIYDQLIKAEVISFLEGKSACYDLVIAGDVVVYFGDLAALFALVAKALRENGMFVFNAEINNEIDFTLSESGRFTHCKTYLDALIAKYHFKTLSYQTGTMRTQENQQVMGHLYVLQLEAP